MARPNKMGMTDKQLLRRRGANAAAREAAKTPEQRAAEDAERAKNPLIAIMIKVGNGEMTVAEGVAAAEAIQRGEA
jgi:hypothetical protein